MSKKKDYTVSVKGADGEYKEVDMDRLEKVAKGFKNGLKNANDNFVLTPEMTARFDNFEIHAGKLKDGLYLTANFSQKTDWNTWPSGGMEYPELVHDDLKNAFHELNVHFAIISEQVVLENDEDSGMPIDISIEEILADEIKSKIVMAMKVTGFKISGSGTNEGVALNGTKILSTGQVLNLSTPTTKWKDDQHQYKYADELSQVMEKIKFEMLLFMHGKHAPEKQQVLPLDEVQELVEA